MEPKIAFYERLLFSYLAVYALLHSLTLLFLILFESGWGFVFYLYIFFLHFPIFLGAVALSFLGKKTQQSLVWLLALLIYLFSNIWWLLMTLAIGNLFNLLPMLVTVVPIFATAQLTLLTKTEETKVPKA